MNTSKKSVYATHTTDMYEEKVKGRAQTGDNPYTIVARYDHLNNSILDSLLIYYEKHILTPH